VDKAPWLRLQIAGAKKKTFFAMLKQKKQVNLHLTVAPAIAIDRAWPK
jgi:hypothetical protein